MAGKADSKREGEVAAAALLLLLKRSKHTLQLALLGAARKTGTVLETRESVEAALSGAVRGAREAAQQLSGRAFARQTGYEPSAERVASGTGRDAAGSLADQWATRAGVIADSEGVSAEGAVLTRAAQDLGWACERTAVTEVFSEYALEAKAAFEELVEAGATGVIRIWKAQLEACPMCKPLHDTVADSTGQFPYGDPLLHINCQCFVVTEFHGSYSVKEESKPRLDTLGKAVALVNMLGVANAEFMRDPNSYKDMALVRAAYEGATPEEAELIATGKLPAKDSGKLLPPVKVTVDSGEVHLEDGRHRLKAAQEAGAKNIHAVVATYNENAEKIRRPAVVSIGGKK